jgi:LPS-assembly protein
MGINYVTSYTYSAGAAPPVLGHAYTFQIGLRTIANTTTSSSGTGGFQ